MLRPKNRIEVADERQRHLTVPLIVFCSKWLCGWLLRSEVIVKHTIYVARESSQSPCNILWRLIFDNSQCNLFNKAEHTGEWSAKGPPVHPAMADGAESKTCCCARICRVDYRCIVLCCPGKERTSTPCYVTRKHGWFIENKRRIIVLSNDEYFHK